MAARLPQESGRWLEERVVETELVQRHTETAAQVLPWAMALTVVAVAVVAADRLRTRTAAIAATATTVALLIAAGITATGATWTIIEIGHLR